MNIAMYVIMNFSEIALVLAILNAVIAFLLLAWPGICIKLNEMISKWISIEKIEEELNKRRNIDAGFMRFSKIVGYVCAIQAIILLYIYIKKV